MYIKRMSKLDEDPIVEHVSGIFAGSAYYMSEKGVQETDYSYLHVLCTGTMYISHMSTMSCICILHVYAENTMEHVTCKSCAYNSPYICNM